MREIFDKNIEALKSKTHEKEIKLLKKISKQVNKDIVEVVSKDGKSNILLNKGDNKVYLHSKYNIEKEAERWVEQFDGDKYDGLVVLGFGMGYHIKKFNQEYPNIPILVLEPNQHVFIHALKHVDLTSILNKDYIKLIVGDNLTNKIKGLFSKWTHEMKYFKYHITCLSSYSNIYSIEFSAVKDVIWKFNNRLWVLINTERKMRKLWLRNTILNYKHALNNASAQDFIGKFKDIPLVIASAGPSIQKNINILKQYEKKVFIIAVGSAVGVLKKNNIKPDMASFIDGHPIEEKVFDSGEDNFDYILYTSNLYNKILDKSNVPKIYIPLNTTKLDKWLYKVKETCFESVFQSGPSVANITYDIAVKWGFNPIILIGQDMSYLNDKSHAEGAAYIRDLNDENKKSSNCIKLTDIYGNDVYSDKGFLQMKEWFENYNENCLHLPEVINCTEGGIGIKDIPNRGLEEILNKIKNKVDSKNYYMNRILCEIRGKNHKNINAKAAYINLLQQLTRAEEIIKNRIDIMNDFITKYENGNSSYDEFNDLLRADDLLGKTIDEECEDLEEFLKISNVIHLFVKNNRKLLKKVGHDNLKQNILEIKGTMNQLVEKLQDIWIAKGTVREAMDSLQQNS